MGDRLPYPDPKTPEGAQAFLPNSGWFPHSPPALRGDTYPMTWGDDDLLYAAAGDPNWGVKFDGLDVNVFEGIPPAYAIRRINPMPDYRGNGGEGVKPTGMLCLDGVLYLAFQNLLGKKPAPHSGKSQHGSDAAIVASRDHGVTWEPDIRAMKAPMFPGSAFGGPAFVNRGMNHSGVRDGFAYAISSDQWDNGSHLRLGRVPGGRILEAGAWEWVAGLDAAGQPRWTRTLAEAAPVLERPRRLGVPEMAWVGALDRHLLFTWSLREDFTPDGSALAVWEAADPWGPFELVHEEESWESADVTPYCPRLPLKWVRAVPGGIEGWLQFSGSWRQDSPHYRSHVRPFRLVRA